MLGAALSVLATWPDKCKFRNGKINGSKIAAMVGEKSPLFWRDTGEPPLKTNKITDLVNDWINKTNSDKTNE